LLIVLIVVMAAELLLSGIIARERFGSAPISESSELVSSMAGTASPFEEKPVTISGMRTPKDGVHSTQTKEERVGSLAR
jgi:hypothetical protein